MSHDTADGRVEDVEAKSNDAREFFRAHLYETHDVWHVVTGFDTDVPGELGLQGFYLAQIPNALPLLLIAIGFVRNALYDESLTEPFVEALVRGYRMGKTAKPFFGVRWDELWNVPLEDVQSRLGVRAKKTFLSQRERYPEQPGTSARDPNHPFGVDDASQVSKRTPGSPLSSGVS